MDNKKIDVIVVGCGFAGATVARLLADHNKKVLILEERNHFGGNSFDKLNEDGILIHPYGPHIFHTNEKRVMDFLLRFSDFVDYKHRVKGNIDNKIVPIPFNFSSIELCFEKTKADEIKKRLLDAFENKKTVSIFDLLECDDCIIKEFGNFVYEKVFERYTAKQWSCDISKIDKSVINRVPVVLGYTDTYFHDEFQCMPRYGFNRLFKNILNCKLIDIELNTKAEDVLSVVGSKVFYKGKLFNGVVIFTGEIDKFFNYEFGHLSYRSLDFAFETLPVDSYQEAAVVNYNTSEDYTRITEFKKLTGQEKEGLTTILKEYPLTYDSTKGMIPFYPINDVPNNTLYNRYFEKAKSIDNFYCCGRLAEYKYYNMDKVISRAMDVVEEILNK